MRRNHFFIAFIPTLAALLVTAQTSFAQTLTTLTSFNGTDGQLPEGNLILSGSKLYGTTNEGGFSNGGEGTVFSIPVSGGAPTKLTTFNGTDGAYPEGGLVLSGSTLYGTTNEGGSGFVNGNLGDGFVFGVPVTGGGPTTLLAFNGTNGENPINGLVLSGSTLYGDVRSASEGPGIVYSVPVSGGSSTTLASFNTTNGADPYGTLTLGGGTLFGTTLAGGANSDGTVFSIPASGSAITTLTSFAGTNGAEPIGNLTLSADGSTLFGTTWSGGSYNHGTIFSLPVAGGTPTVLASFDGANGSDPAGNLVLIGSTLFGTASQGGPGGDGTIFSIPVTGGAITTLASFSGNNGDEPMGGLTVDSTGSILYGTTVTGGANNLGTVFALNLATPEPSSLVLLGLGLAGLSVTVLRRLGRRNN